MVVMVDRIMVFKEENSSPLTYDGMRAQYRGAEYKTSSYPYADAQIRKLMIRSFDFSEDSAFNVI